MMNMKHWIWFLILIPMMNRSERYQKYSDYTAEQAINTGIGWMQLLETMAHNSKRTTQELLFIHFQCPEARNCKTYQEWINTGRKVKRGAIGIAVVDQTNPEKMRFLFDQNDTVGGKAVGTAWSFPRQNESDMIKDLEKSFHVRESFSFPALIESAVSKLIDTYWYDHEKEILAGIMPCWHGTDEYSLKLQFVDAAFYSTCYMLLERCGYSPRSHYDYQDFLCVHDFNSPTAMNVLGETIRNVGNQVLDEIEKSISERNKTVLAEGEQSLSAFLKSKLKKKEKEAR